MKEKEIATTDLLLISKGGDAFCPSTSFKGSDTAYPNDRAIAGLLVLSSPRTIESAGDLQLPQGRPKLPTSFMRSRCFLFTFNRDSGTFLFTAFSRLAIDIL